MKLKFQRPRMVESLAKVPGLHRPVRSAYDNWLRFSYDRFWKWHNAKARRQFELHKPALDAVQQRVLGELLERGFAHVHFNELMGNGGYWEFLCDQVRAWVFSPEVQAEERAYREGGFKEASFKEYLVRMFRHDGGRDALIPWDNPWLRLAIEPRIMDVANHYLGMFSRMFHVDVWDTIALDHDGPLVGPQRWHRDPADIRLVKAFLYFTDVDADSGAMQYVPYSRPGEKYGDLWPADIPFDGARPPADEFEKRIPPSEWVTCAHPAGTLVFADTIGFHRGGRAAKRNRVLATWGYCSPTALWPSTYRVDLDNVPPDLSPAARYALLPPG